MTTPTTAVGDVVQIDPAHDMTFGGHFLVVTEVKSWGVVGYVASLEKREDPAISPPLAYYRCQSGKFVRIGRAEWATQDL